ncbi:TetR/AcrR family transcriptional regulator [Desulfogranum japonicum]|uniref:TetR/AcrR family transcriptional regulator n=1 Tax=Desulfogranum japonicum TaxID=231447 RepID=UPI0003F65E82|nr:TetR/AcrR family transcriptional regulator [Desulfogranum japonicum]
MVRIVKKPEERKNEIISAACQLFLKKGYDNTTMAQVMKTLNIAKGTIYHYFSSKEDLLEAVVCSIAEDEQARLQEAYDSHQGTVLERLHLLVMSSSHPPEGHEDFLEDLHQTANTGMHIRLLSQILIRQAPLYARLIEEGCDEGIFSTSHPLECSEFLLSAIHFLTDRGIHPWTEEQLTRRWQAFPDLVTSLVNAPKGTFDYLQDIFQPTTD